MPIPFPLDFCSTQQQPPPKKKPYAEIITGLTTRNSELKDTQ